MDLLCGEELAYFRCQGRNMEDGSNNYLEKRGPGRQEAFALFTLTWHTILIQSNLKDLTFYLRYLKNLLALLESLSLKKHSSYAQREFKQ